MIKQLMVCTLFLSAAKAMHTCATPTHVLYNLIRNERNTEEDIMHALATRKDFAFINVNEEIHPHCEAYGCNTVLHAAVERGFSHVITFLAQLGAHVEKLDESGWKPLGLALIADSPEPLVIRALLQAGALTERVGGFERDTALTMAFKRPNIIKILLDCGADATTYNGLEHTALTIAAMDGEARTCQELLHTAKSRTQVLARFKAQPNLCTIALALQTTNNLAQRRALRKRCISKYLLTQQTGDGDTALTLALRFNQDTVVTEIVKCLTYHEILGAITFAKRFGRYGTLLNALRSPENYPSIVTEARAYNNQELLAELMWAKTIKTTDT